MVRTQTISVFPHRQFHMYTLLSSLFKVGLHCQTPTLMPVSKQEGSLYHFMMVFGMTWPWHEPSTYRMSTNQQCDESCSQGTYIPLQDGSEAVGHEFMPRPGHTTNQHKNGKNCLELHAWQASIRVVCGAVYGDTQF